MVSVCRDFHNAQTVKRSIKIHEQLDHPVSDADAHFVESFSTLACFFKEEGIDELPELIEQASFGKLKIEASDKV